MNDKTSQEILDDIVKQANIISTQTIKEQANYIIVTNPFYLNMFSLNT